MSTDVLHWSRIRTVIAKEWAETRRNKMILWITALLPVLLVAIILGTDYFILRLDAAGEDTDADELPIPEHLLHLPQIEAFLIQMNEQYMFYLFIIPMMLPVYIAAYTIIGEKQSNTLEPLLATPVSTWELLAAKTIAAALPAIVAVWLCFGALILGLKWVTPPSVFQYNARPVWIVAMGLLSPLLAFLSVLVGVIVSSRINDPRTAQQITGIFILPIIGMSLMVLAGWVFVSVPLVLLASLGTLILDLIALYFAVKLFDRETILTRWK